MVSTTFTASELDWSQLEQLEPAGAASWSILKTKFGHRGFPVTETRTIPGSPEPKLTAEGPAFSTELNWSQPEPAYSTKKLKQLEPAVAAILAYWSSNYFGHQGFPVTERTILGLTGP